METYDVERLRRMAYASVFAALVGAGALVSIPIGPVPITLQTFFVLLAGFVLGPRWGAVSVALYLLLGAAGLPVFSGGAAGAGVLVGPTAGYLWAFPAAAFLAGLLAAAGHGRGGATRFALKLVGGALGSLVVLAAGTAVLALVLGLGAREALLVGFVPFVPVSALEIAGAAAVSESLNRAGVASASSGPEVRGSDERAVYAGALGLTLSFGALLPWARLSTTREGVELAALVPGYFAGGELALTADGVEEHVAVETPSLLAYGSASSLLGLACVALAADVARGRSERLAVAGYALAGAAAVAVGVLGGLDVAGWGLDVDVGVGYAAALTVGAGLALVGLALHSRRRL